VEADDRPWILRQGADPKKEIREDPWKSVAKVLAASAA
jgi:hypothetical protein